MPKPLEVLKTLFHRTAKYESQYKKVKGTNERHEYKGNGHSATLTLPEQTLGEFGGGRGGGEIRREMGFSEFQTPNSNTSDYGTMSSPPSFDSRTSDVTPASENSLGEPRHSSTTSSSFMSLRIANPDVTSSSSDFGCSSTTSPSLPDRILPAFPDLYIQESDAELFPESALSTPVSALKQSRDRLCFMLNMEQKLANREYPPNYKGLAVKVGFDAHTIGNFWEANPSDTLFASWSRNEGAFLQPPVLRTLVQCLEQLGRRDILKECRGLILEDVGVFIAGQNLMEAHAVTRERPNGFHCYVNIADEDILTVGREILDMLEGVYGLKLCLTLRDLTLGGCHFESMAEMLEKKCNSKVLIVLTKNYEDSDACQFLTDFAVTLDPASHKKKLVPLLVDESVCIPRQLQARTMANYKRDKHLGFLWSRLNKQILE